MHSGCVVGVSVRPSVYASVIGRGGKRIMGFLVFVKALLKLSAFTQAITLS